MSYQKEIKVVALSLIASTFMVGCGSGSGATTVTQTRSISGVASDPQLQGANVFLDANGNGIFDANETNVTTDNLGRYDMNISKEDIGKNIVVTGGTDMVTKEPFTGTLSTIAQENNSSNHITPLTTLMQKYKKEHSYKSIDEVKSELADKMGLSPSDIEKNTAKAGNERVLKVALRVQKVLEAIKRENADSNQTMSSLYAKVALRLKNVNLSKALDDTADNEFGQGSFKSAKIKDLNKELENLSQPSTTEQLALSVDNIDHNITNTTNKAELDSNLYNNSNILVTTDTDVENERDRRVLNGLGLGGLDENTKAVVIQKLKEKEDLKTARIDGIKERLKNNAFNFSSGVKDKISGEQFFDKVGISKLDSSTKESLMEKIKNNPNLIEKIKNNPDSNSTIADFKDRFEHNDFGLSDEEKAKIQSQMSKFNSMRNPNMANQTTIDSNTSAQIAKDLASTTLPSLHILPRILDEDGNATDAKETYTLNANKDVNVTIQTPNGSWITPMYRYNNNPLPVLIRANRGDAMTLKFNNQLDTNSTIHWHGFKIPADMDGGPDYPVISGGSKTYAFTMNQPASPLWFHPHPDMDTGRQVYMGLAGIFLLDDNISKTLEANNELPSGDKDIVLAVQDRRFNAESNGVRELAYKTQAMDSDGMYGDVILVNGSQMPKLNVSTTKYRFRIYSVSNARTYDFAFSDGREFTVVGTDGGLLKNPVKVKHILLGAAERAEIVVDFANDKVGDKVLLISKPFTVGSMGMNTQNMNTLPNGAGFDVMRFDVSSQESDNVTLYSELPSSAEITNRLSEADADNVGNERQFIMTMAGMGNMGANQNSSNMQNSSTNSSQMTFVINGKSFDPNRVDEYIKSGATEIWDIKNMSPMAHPFHAHALQYQILTRNGQPASGTDLGWKDTFLVQPGESVRIIGKFDPVINKGDYMYHCHILEHEDAGMMGYFRVGDSGHIGN